jgi:hypothetical protein
MTFDRFVGIDDSGAETPASHLKTLQAYRAPPGADPQALRPATPARHGSRQVAGIGGALPLRCTMPARHYSNRPLSESCDDA